MIPHAQWGFDTPTIQMYTDWALKSLETRVDAKQGLVYRI